MVERSFRVSCPVDHSGVDFTACYGSPLTGTAIMSEYRIQDYFCLTEDGAACRTADYTGLTEQYKIGDLINEVVSVLANDEERKDKILPALSYVYLYAYFFYEHHEIEAIRLKGASYIKKYERATSPGFWSLFSSKPPECITTNYNHYKKEAPILDAALPLIHFNQERADNYDTHAETIRSNTHQIDRWLSQLNASVPPVIFRLMDYMDRECAGKKRERRIWK